ncbi:hypothetical protein FQN57_005726 [Myotisia sp. PD_48]|nr:hypothetical protein FQN57_005726 [Myotisia sp. PD_48]
MASWYHHRRTSSPNSPRTPDSNLSFSSTPRHNPAPAQTTGNGRANATKEPTAGAPSKVGFTIGPDDENSGSDTEEGLQLPTDYNPPQPPPYAYRPSVPRFQSTDIPPPWQPPSPPESSPSRPIDIQPNQATIDGQQKTSPKARTVQSAYEKAQNLAYRVRRSSFFSPQKNPTSHRISQANGQTGDAVISMSGPADEREEWNEKAMHRADEPDPYHVPWDERPDLGDEREEQHTGRGVLSDLLQLNRYTEAKRKGKGKNGIGGLRPFAKFPNSMRPSGTNRPRSRTRWYEKSKRRSSSSSVNSIGSDATLREEGDLKRSRSSGMLASAVKRRRKKPGLEDEIRITVHVAETISRQRYLEKLCDALMAYGAPTHRLEECLRMTSRVLELDAQFLYLPGCMFISFNDSTTHTTELKMRRCEQGVDLGRLEDVHEIYKDVVHDMIGVEEAMRLLDNVHAQKPRYNMFVLILLYGFASASVAPFAFNGRAIDLPIAFSLGCLLGLLKYLLVPRSRLYANIFELTAALLLSFLARVFGSIRVNNDHIFCFPALAQSSIALILPGFMVLCSSLELQSQNILAGSVRLVFALIYSLVLGFGMMLGTTFYGKMDPDASSVYMCPIDEKRNEYAYNFPSVIAFTLCLNFINQAKWRQMPVMVIISFTGYVVSFFMGKIFPSNLQIANAMGAFVIGILGNLYSRISHGMAATAMLPAILVQVPSGIAASGSLVSGLAIANQETEGSRGGPGVFSSNSATATMASLASATSATMGGSPTSGGAGAAAQAGGATGTDLAREMSARMGTSKVYGDVVFDLAYAMIQVSISTTVGLFLAALIVYPYGKRRSELFSF